MKKNIFILLIFLFSYFSLIFCQTKEPNILWEKIYGGEKNDSAMAIIETKEGYVFVGESSSYNLGSAYIVEIDKKGNKIWEQVYNGIGIAGAMSIVESQMGYVFAGYTLPPYGGPSIIYIVKIDKLGKIIWDTKIGNNDFDAAYSIIKADDGYIFVGISSALNPGNKDAYIVKIDENGKKIWEKAFGGKKEACAKSIIKISDGYVFVGYTKSQSQGGFDVYIVKIDVNGNLIWEKTFGGIKDDRAFSVCEISDGYIIAGDTLSFKENFEDIYVIKVDKKGNKVWEKTFGGVFTDSARSIIKTKDGNIIFTGYSNSFGEGKENVYIVKLDVNGNIIWQKVLGSKSLDYSHNLIETNDGIVIAGSSLSFGNGLSDAYIIKLVY